MISMRPAAQRGQAGHGWLRSAHTFWFGSYFDLEQSTGFSDLLVIVGETDLDFTNGCIRQKSHVRATFYGGGKEDYTDMHSLILEKLPNKFKVQGLLEDQRQRVAHWR